MKDQVSLDALPEARRIEKMFIENVLQSEDLKNFEWTWKLENNVIGELWYFIWASAWQTEEERGIETEVVPDFGTHFGFWKRFGAC